MTEPASAPVDDDTAADSKARDLRHHRILQISEAILLAVVTITAAWAGFSAAKWGTESRLQLASASTDRIEANREYGISQAQKNFDASAFNAWFVAYTLDKPDKMAIAERRFSPTFKTAFTAWMATDPDTNPNAPAGPSYMPQYVLASDSRGQALDAQATAKSAIGDAAGTTSDEYVRITVFLAGVLFLVGIGSTFSMPTVRYALLGVGAVLLVSALVLLAQQPRPPV